MTETLTERAYTVAKLEDVPSISRHENRRRFEVRDHLGIGAFGVNAYRVDAAEVRVIGEHDETGPASGEHEELYVVLAGRATFTVAEEEVDAPAGTLVFVRPGTKRGAIGQEPGTTVLVIGAGRGKAYAPPPWEPFREFGPHYQAKDYEAALRVIEEGLAEHPDSGLGLYNAACMEALLGRTDASLKHLKKAIARDERFLELARGDEDFDSLRDDPRFAAIVPA
jgi:mannose-6-phosphate isomerase-like protein (cupin superfamily)